LEGEGSVLLEGPVRDEAVRVDVEVLHGRGGRAVVGGMESEFAVRYEPEVAWTGN